MNLQVDDSKLGYYYFVFEQDPNKLNRLISGFDEQGVPMNQAYIDVDSEGLHYYPISIGQYGLSVFHTYLKTKEEESKALFLRIADWFVQHAEQDERLGAFWRTHIPKPEFEIESGWKSGFSQSRALSILLRAWQLTGDHKYLELATQALQVFQYDIKEGGVAIRRIQGEVFYEEYVAQAPTRVLDGHGFIMFGLYDYVRAVSEEEDAEGAKLARRLFEEGIDGLKNLLPSFELGFWLRFSNCELENYPKDDPCTINYLKIVIDQLEVLYRISGEPVLAKKRKEYLRYFKFNNIIKMYRFKFSSLRKLNRL